MTFAAAQAATRRYDATGQDRDLRRALAAWEMALRGLPDDAGEDAQRGRVTYATLNLEAFWRWGDPAYLVRALDVLQALPWPDLPPDLRLAAANALAMALQDRFQVQGRREDLEEAIAQWEAVLPLAQDPEQRARLLNNLATAYAMLGDLDPESPGWDRARELWQEVLALLPPEHPIALIARGNLAASLRTRFLHTGRATDLDRSQKLLQAVVERLPAGPDRALFRNNLALTLWERYQHFGDLAALEAAREQWLRALEELPPTAAQRVAVGHHAVLAQVARARALRLSQDLAQARTLLQTLRDQALGPEDRALLAKAEAAYHEAEYELRGDLHALARGQAVLQQALAEPNLSADLQRTLQNQQARLAWARYQRTGDRNALHQARAGWRALLAQTPPDHPDAAVWRANWVLAVLEDEDDPTALEDARHELEHSLAALPRGTPTWAQAAANLALVLQALAHSATKPHRARALVRQSLRLFLQARRAVREHSEPCLRLTNDLASGLWDAAQVEDRPGWRALALRTWKAVAQEALETQPEAALAASWNLAKWAFHQQDWDRVMDALERGWAVVRDLYTQQVLPGYGLAWLREVQDWPGMHAYALVRLGRLRDAVEALEQGRTWLLREALGLRELDLARARAQVPETVYRAYCAARAQEAHLLALPPAARTPDWADALRAAREARRQAEAALRTHLGAPSPLEAALSWPALRALAREHGPLLYLVTTVHGGLALLVHGDRDHPVVLDLPRLLQPQAQRHLERLQAAFRDLDAGRDPNPAREALNAALAWLREALAPLASWPELAREPGLILVPTGPLSRLPLHAVPITSGQPWGFKTLLRYAVSASILVQAHAEPAAPGYLLVGDPTGDLPRARAEVQAIAGLVPEPVEVLLGPQATRDAVRRGLPRAGGFHFAGHARLGPLGVELALADGALTWPELGSVRTRGRLAVLSGCETGLVDPRIPEEALGLPAAFHLMGYPQVVASFWPVDDALATLFMFRFYEGLRAEPSPARALQAVQQWLARATWAEVDAYLDALRREGRASALVLTLRPWVKRARARDESPSLALNHPLAWAGFALWGLGPTHTRRANHA